MPILPILTNMIGIAAIGIGIFAIYAPTPAAKLFGIPTSGSGLAFVRSLGARDIFIGILLLLVLRAESPALLGELYLATAIVSATDCVMVFKNGSRKIAATHALGAVAGLGLGAWILSYV